MDDIFLYIGALIGFLLLSVNIVLKLKRKFSKKQSNISISLSNCVGIFVSGFGIGASARFGLLFFSFKNLKDIDRSFFLIGGMAVIYVCIEQICRLWGDAGPKIKK